MRLRTSLVPTLLIALGATFVAACSAQDSASSKLDAPAVIAGVPDAKGSVVSSRDPDGSPTFVWAAPRHVAIAGAAADVARTHLVKHASLLGISEHLATTARLAGEHKLPGGGSVLSFDQKVSGITVFRTKANVVMDRTNNLVAISGNLRAAAEAPSKMSHFVITPEEALAKAYEDKFGVPMSTSDISLSKIESNGEYRTYTMRAPAGAPRILDTARVRKIYVPQKGQLLAAYHAEFLSRARGSTKNSAWLYAIAADDGRTLIKNSLTANEKFTYRVWAESGATSQHNIPLDGPLADTTPLPATATPQNTKENSYAPTVLVSVDGFNKTADPWLPATATQTKGNNVDAYTDRNDQGDQANTGDGFDEGVDLRANTTAPLTFDRQYNTGLAPNASPDQMKAAVTQIFYVTNWLHDYWYDSGFDEASGNAQQSNLGRGGMEGDPLNAQGQDGADFGQLDNANMSSFSDGMPPKMQMYVWSAARTITVTATPSAGLADQVNQAAFGPTTFDVTANGVISTPPDACTAVTGVTGKIAVVDRGTCTFAQKAKAAQDAGAAGIIIVNNAPGHTTPGLAGDGMTTVTIPIAGLTLEDGALLKAKLAAGTVSLRLKRDPSVLRDGTIDNGVVAHEWGHYLHHRLVLCGASQCNGMSEGWADFDALMMVIKDGDDLDHGSYPLTQYASAAGSDSGSYYGIRRTPYSSDLTKDAFTFKDINEQEMDLPTTAPMNPLPGNSEDHNVGEIWAVSLFEGYTNMLRDTKLPNPRFDFTTAKRRMADYVVAGMKATPVEPSFTEQRDAVLAVAYASDQKDFQALAKGFAKRGMGVGAESPPIDSQGYSEVKEDFSFKGNLAFLDATVDDAVRSCDRDGFLDADEKGDLTIQLKNAGWVTLANTTVTVTTTADGVTFANGGAASVVSVDPFGVAKVRIGVALDPKLAVQEFLPITITIANGMSFKQSVQGKVSPLGNFDVQPNSAKTDDVEGPKPVWTMTHGVAGTPSAWSRQTHSDATPDSPNYEWVGADLGTRSDESLVSPTLEVSATDAFKIMFTHQYSFEFGPNDGRNGPLAYFDGAVLEVSKDDGTTWEDVSVYGNPGYTHTINTNTAQGGGDPATDDNPLAGRMGYAGELTTATPVTVNLGTALAGKKVKVRFRVGSDPASSAKGWEVDNIAFVGITNNPFPTNIVDASTCMGVPVAVAGMAKTVAPGAKVVLDGSGSSDPDGNPITFAWTQLDGENVELSTPTEAKAGFTAPMATAVTKLVFRVTVADAHQAASDTVEITVNPKAASNPPGSGPPDNSSSMTSPPASGSDCGCSTVGMNGTTGLGAIGAALAGVLALAARKRRRVR